MSLLFDFVLAFLQFSRNVVKRWFIDIHCWQARTTQFHSAVFFFQLTKEIIFIYCSDVDSDIQLNEKKGIYLG